MSDRSTGQAPSRLVAVLGPTNTGKTHLAVERMLGHASGMIGLPLRLLAREIYDRVVKLKGQRNVALITGEEKIVPPRAAYFVCTVEAMPLNRQVEFLGVDEIQLCADPERGHVFTHRLLHARGRFETMFLGASTIGPLIRRLLPDAEFVSRERFSALTYVGSKKLTRLPPRTAVVAFSAEAVYAIAELIRRQRGGAAVVMGSLSPRTRNAQVALYQSGEVDFLVATDAIGMGLNMDVGHVAFAGLRKFDGRRTRWLHAHEVAQIAGRAGRYTRDGTFGVTGEAEDMDEDLVQAVQEHAFQPIVAAEWRNAGLDLSNLPNLLRSLAAPPNRPGLKLSEQSLDEQTLRLLAQSDEIERRVRDRSALIKLWDACQLPDFQKVRVDQHAWLVRSIFEQLSGPGGRLAEDWMAGQFASLDRATGDIDTLAGRLAGVRTLSYVAARPDWLRDPGHWQARTKALEERLSDTLHERLMQRFIDRRTSVLMRALNVHEEVVAGVGADGAVTVEGHDVGRLNGVVFTAAQGVGELEKKALRAAAKRAVEPEVAARLGRLAADGDEAFAIGGDGVIGWRGDPAGKLIGGGPFSPRVRLLGEFGSEPARERATRRLEAFVAADAGRRLSSLKRLSDAVADGTLKGIPRGIAYRLVESGGVLPRSAAAAEARALSQVERRTLKGLGVRLGAFSLWLPQVLGNPARPIVEALAGLSPTTPPPRGQVSRLTREQAAAPAAALTWRGLQAVGAMAAPVEALERLDALMRAASTRPGAGALSDQALEELGWSRAEAGEILQGLDFFVPKPREGEPLAWKVRRAGDASPAPPARAASPFAALASLAPAEVAAPSTRRPRRRRPARRSVERKSSS